eukprot:gnl/Chilomastix_cuspidata/5339.p1 GENE.gnl/Chilomastix_cuspidata/5339~~gnl/Chilomastix_cuspidata/5339.p1  ORF type:complete len:506 (+),score=78.52 gnl/Chilomastix_cuspidata/5339:75-1520(+)
MVMLLSILLLAPALALDWSCNYINEMDMENGHRYEISINQATEIMARIAVNGPALVTLGFSSVLMGSESSVQVSSFMRSSICPSSWLDEFFDDSYEYSMPDEVSYTTDGAGYMFLLLTFKSAGEMISVSLSVFEPDVSDFDAYSLTTRPYEYISWSNVANNFDDARMFVQARAGTYMLHFDSFSLEESDDRLYYSTGDCTFESNDGYFSGTNDLTSQYPDDTSYFEASSSNACFGLALMTDEYGMSEGAKAHVAFIADTSSSTTSYISTLPATVSWDKVQSGRVEDKFIYLPLYNGAVEVTIDVNEFSSAGDDAMVLVMARGSGVWELSATIEPGASSVEFELNTDMFNTLWLQCWVGAVAKGSALELSVHVREPEEGISVVVWIALAAGAVVVIVSIIVVVCCCSRKRKRGLARGQAGVPYEGDQRAYNPIGSPIVPTNGRRDQALLGDSDNDFHQRGPHVQQFTDENFYAPPRREYVQY